MGAQRERVHPREDTPTGTNEGEGEGVQEGGALTPTPHGLSSLANCPFCSPFSVGVASPFPGSVASALALALTSCSPWSPSLSLTTGCFPFPGTAACRFLLLCLLLHFLGSHHCCSVCVWVLLSLDVQPFLPQDELSGS